MLSNTQNFVIDFHCDLLSCVENPSLRLNFFSPETNCSLPQLKKGKLLIQTFAIATISHDRAVDSGLRQGLLYQKLLEEHPEDIVSIKKYPAFPHQIYGLLSIENASSLAGEEEHLERAFERLKFFEEIETIGYISLTWNHENRFGGGNNTSIGLKDDGKALLDYLNHKNIAIDLSHASDKLAEDILTYISRKDLNITPIASHSNFRSITPIVRNLPDEFVKEIVKRKGVIGINLIKRFLGETEQSLIKQIEYGIGLGARDHLVFGSDFYGGMDPSYLSSLMPEKTWPTFFPSFANAGDFPRVSAYLAQEFSSEIVNKITHLNALHFLKIQKIVN